MNTIENLERITLYHREGSSDKVYQVNIEPRENGFVVNFAFGRRGSSLNTGTKTQVPVDYPAAQEIYQRLIKEKKAKGYTEGPDGKPYTHTEQENRVSGFLPQLLNAVSEEELPKYITDANWCLQEKFDGKRMLLLKSSEQLQGINRKGLFVAVSKTIIKDAQKIDGDFLIDGEAVGEIYYVFDLLSRHGEDIRHLSYCWRLDNLAQVTEKLRTISLRQVITCFKEKEKREQLKLLRQVNAEGVVFKNLNAPYTSGRPNAGGPQLKCKFCATLTAVVSRINTGRSVELRLLGKEGWIPCGNVTIPSNRPIPNQGETVEVRYLYAFPESRALFQPVYLGARSDVDHSECMVSQLKFKRPEEEES
jgi:bifunctional non-homologous end joining protein LigD